MNTAFPACPRGPRFARSAQRFALSTITLALLSACGSDNDDPPPPDPITISGVVADGPLNGATVCYDLNDNETCDAGEPASAVTDADGRYSLSMDPALAGKHAVLALVPATAVDKDTGAAIGAALKLKSPATSTSGAQNVFVSPLTTLVADVAKESGKSVADAAALVKEGLGLSASPLAAFSATGDAGSAQAALAARAVTAVMVEATNLSTTAGLSAADAGRYARVLASSSLPVLASALADAASTATTAEKVAQAVAAVKEDANLSATTAKAVAEATIKATGTGVTITAGPFISVRRFAYTDANNYSYILFTGDSSKTNAAGEYPASEVRKTLSNSADVPFNRNQMYWTGTEWKVCNTQFEVVSVKADAATQSQSTVYCGGSRAQTQNNYEDISGKKLRDVITSMRAHPLADSVGSTTNAEGLPVNWGPDPALLPADATFPAGSVLNRRRQLAEIGATDRVDMVTKNTVRWPDGRFRQATSLEQYGAMTGDLIDPAAVVSATTTNYVADLPLANQPDTTLEAFKRWRAGIDITAMKARFYQCDVRKADNASLNCTAAGDATVAISTQGGARVLRFASGYPAALSSQLKWQRYWLEHSGTVFRGLRDLPNTRYDQRLNNVAWDALRTALAIPAHTPAVAQAAAPGPFDTLRNFTFTDANNYNYRRFVGDSSLVNTTGQYAFSETRGIKSGGVATTFARNQLYWTGTEWYDCPSNGLNIGLSGSTAPILSTYCKAYDDERTGSTVLTLAGRRMSDVVNDIRAFGSKDATFDYGGWGPSTATNTQLASNFFPAGSTMEYRANTRKATPIALATDTGSKVRVAPAANSTAAFDTWPYAANLEEFISKYPGDLKGGSLNGNVAVWIHGITLAAAPSNTLNRTFEWRVAFDADGQKARIYTNNRTASGNFTTNYVKVLDTTYTIETIGGNRVLKFAAMPDGFERDHFFQRMFGEREGAVWYAFKDHVPATPMYSIRLNGTAATALFSTLGVN